MISVDAVRPSMSPTARLHGRRNVALALTISAMLHAFAYLATPYFVLAWHEPAASRFEAILVPIAESPAEKFSALKSVAPAAGRAPVAKSASPRRTASTRTAAKFVAPANAIAVAPPEVAADETPKDVGTDNIAPINAAGEADKSVVGPDTSTAANLATTPLIAQAIPQKVELAVEKPATLPTELPARITIAYRMSSSLSDGVADYTWTRKGQQFEIDSSMQATGFIVGNLVGVLHQVSRGTITPAGLRPASFQIRRGEALPDSADFLYASNELKLSRGSGQVRTVPLVPQLQDMQSFLFQLAYDAAKLQSTDDRLEVMVTNARKVYRHRFRQVGIEIVQTSIGPVQTVHLRSEAADPEDTYEVWLAPGNYHLPVKLRFYAGRFPVELIAASIRTTP